MEKNENINPELIARPLRPRIKVQKLESTIMEDPLTFSQNKCSQNARRIHADIEKVGFEIWFDKHYHDRSQHGDNNGKRDGIDHEVVQSLVSRGLKHLLLYSSNLKGFYFINHQPEMGHAVRIVLQERSNGTMLNVVIEAHFVNINNYEITVKTAMQTDEFKLSDGQYSIELQGDSSILRKISSKKLVEVCSF